MLCAAIVCRFGVCEVRKSRSEEERKRYRNLPSTPIFRSSQLPNVHLFRVPCIRAFLTSPVDPLQSVCSGEKGAGENVLPGFFMPCGSRHADIGRDRQYFDKLLKFSGKASTGPDASGSEPGCLNARVADSRAPQRPPGHSVRVLTSPMPERMIPWTLDPVP